MFFYIHLHCGTNSQKFGRSKAIQILLGETIFGWKLKSAHLTIVLRWIFMVLRRLKHKGRHYLVKKLKAS